MGNHVCGCPTLLDRLAVFKCAPSTTSGFQDTNTCTPLHTGITSVYDLCKGTVFCLPIYPIGILKCNPIVQA